MPLNGSGSASQPVGSIYPAVASTLIESGKFNTSIADVYAILSSAIYKDGQSTTTQRIPFAQGISTDTVTEKTSAAGVTVDSVLLKDGGATLTATLTGTNADLSGTLDADGASTLGAAVNLTGTLSPSQITGNQDDYAPTGHAAVTTLRLNSDASRNVTGLAGGAAGRVLTVHNVGTFPIVFTYEDASSTEANRFAFGCTLGGGQTLEMKYDSTSSRWRATYIPEPLGTIKDFGMSTMPAGFLAIDQNVSRTTYASLFNVVGTTWGTGNGSTTFGLYVGAGRALIAAGSGTITESVTDADITTGTDTITVDSNVDKWITGMLCTWNVTGTPPTTSPANLLDDGDTVYIIRTGATSIKLATSLANAQNGTVIDITAAGTGTFTLTHALSARTHGDKGGQETHAMSSTELLAHTHSQEPSVAGGAGSFSGGAVGGADTTGSRGGNAAMNVMNPYAAVTRGIRYC